MSSTTDKFVGITHLSISTANSDQNISECSTSRSLNQANACKQNFIFNSIMFFMNILKYIIFGSREESEVGGFFVFHIYGCRLFQVRSGYVKVNECPAGLEHYPRRVRAPSWGYKQEKSYCENTKKPATSDSSLDPNIFYILSNLLKM